VTGVLAGPSEELCAKTTVLLNQSLMTRLPSYPASLWSNILVQKNNVQETCPEMSKVNRSHVRWAQSDVCGLFSDNVGSWPNGIKLTSELLL
jgi:hypothetical protein